VVDAAVIGAGHNGLVAAALLADAGCALAAGEMTASPVRSPRRVLRA
jgi:cation diffusion facilitator CzcD-associated flavoprotein CzcO